jgi:tripartite-type tricarboxylate transporter receptor subunit TctC
MRAMPGTSDHVMSIVRRHILKLVGASIVATIISSTTSASAWPTKPIRVIVPLAAGTVVDIVSRLVLKELETAFGQPIVIDNRPGAAGTIGAAAVAKSDADGYTILVESSTHTIVPYVYSGLSYDPVRDFTPVIPLASMPLALAVSRSKGIKTINDLVAVGKAKPGSLSYATTGVGTAPHLATERFRLSAGFDALHVPYRGAFSPDLLTGRIDFAYVAIGNNLEFFMDGRLLALAVSGQKRTSTLPDVPTTLEAGYRNSEFDFYIGMFVPVKTPGDIVGRLHKETANILATQGIREKFSKIGAESMIMSQAEFDAMISKEFTSNAELVMSIGLSPN